MHSYGWLDQPPFLFGSAKNIDHLDVCFIGASAQSHNCSVNGGCNCWRGRIFKHAQMHPASKMS